MIKYEVLGLLRKGESSPVSGESLSRELGVSRAAVWKAVEALRQEGYSIEAGRNRGYTLLKVPDPDILNSFEIQSRLLPGGVSWKIRVYKKLASTNDKARELGEGKENGCTAVFALSQTGAKGKRGGSFYATEDTGLYMSLLFPGSRPVCEAAGMGREIASACAETLSGLCGRKCRIEDGSVFREGKKLCGILAEASLELDTDLVRNVVYGIGVHVNERAFPPSFASGSVSLFQLAGHEFLRAQVAAELLNRIGKAVR